MSKTRYIVCLLIFCSAICRAEDVVTTHNFTTLVNSVPAQMIFTEDNKVGTVGDIVYRCTNAEFGVPDGGTGFAIKLYKKGSDVVVSPAFERLNYVEVKFQPPGGYITDSLKIELSKNGVDWTIVPAQISTYGRIVTSFPIDPYYVRIRNTVAAKVAIYQITYKQSDCYCFDHQAE